MSFHWASDKLSHVWVRLFLLFRPLRNLLHEYARLRTFLNTRFLMNFRKSGVLCHFWEKCLAEGVSDFGISWGRWGMKAGAYCSTIANTSDTHIQCIHYTDSQKLNKTHFPAKNITATIKSSKKPKNEFHLPFTLRKSMVRYTELDLFSSNKWWVNPRTTGLLPFGNMTQNC